VLRKYSMNAAPTRQPIVATLVKQLMGEFVDEHRAVSAGVSDSRIVMRLGCE
jgi:hypothetical protein